MKKEKITSEERLLRAIFGDEAVDEGEKSEERKPSKFDDPAEREKLVARVTEALKKLTTREEEVVKLRFGLGDGSPRTLEEVGTIFNVTRKRVRDIEAGALKKLQRSSEK